MPPITYPEVRSDFTKYLESKRLDESYRKQILSCLDRFVTEIKGPMDVIEIFAKLTSGQQHNTNRALRALFNFLENQGYSKRWLDLLRKNIPRDQTGFDINVPSEDRVIQSLQIISKAETYQAYFAVYNLALDSGLRLIEAVRFLNSLIKNQVKPERHGNFYVATLGYFRNSKLAYFGFISAYTMDLIRQVNTQLNYNTVRGNLRKRVSKKILSYKYLRKFAFDTMTNEKLNIPESVADFIQGRIPKTVGARHYMKLKRKAIQFYPRYAEYITQLRHKALN